MHVHMYKSLINKDLDKEYHNFLNRGIKDLKIDF